jgi:hypothetical protein
MVRVPGTDSFVTFASHYAYELFQVAADTGQTRTWAKLRSVRMRAELSRSMELQPHTSLTNPATSWR